MALEAINKVKLAEDEASKIIENALNESKTVVRDAEAKAKSQYTEIIVAANRKSEEIKNKFLEESKEKCEPILANGKKEIQSTLNVEADRFNDAVKLVIERIVNFNGNS